jgi:hypothetical protein
MAASGIMDERGLIAATMLGAHRVCNGHPIFGVIRSDNQKRLPERDPQADDGGLSTVRSTVYGYARAFKE